MADLNTNPPGEGGDPSGQGGSGEGGPDPKAIANENGFLKRKLAEAEAKAKQFEEAEKKRQQDSLSETDRLKAEAEAAKSEAAKARQEGQETLKRAAFMVAAKEAGAANADHAYKLADLSQVTVDAQGNVQGIDGAIGGLKKSAAYLFGTPETPSAGSGGGNPPGGTPGPKKYTAEAIANMSTEEYAKFREGVKSGKIKLS